MKRVPIQFGYNLQRNWNRKRIKNVIDQNQAEPGLCCYLGLFSWLESVINRMGAGQDLLFPVTTVLMSLSRNLNVVF